MKNEKFKETVIHDKFKLAVNKIRCEEQIGKLSELPLGQLQKYSVINSGNSVWVAKLRSRMFYFDEDFSYVI